MTDQHPTIVPPRELIAKWITEARSQDYCSIAEQVAYHTAQWVYDQRGEDNEAKLLQARDQELAECAKWLAEAGYPGPAIFFATKRSALRPKPSLAEQGLAALRSTPCTEQCHYDALFAALNRLKQLEDSNG